MYKGPIVVVECDKQPSPQYKKLLHFIDILVSSFIITPLVINSWRGIWNLCDIYLLPDSPLNSSLVSFLIGGIGYMVFMLPQKLFCDNVDRDKHRLTFYLFSRFYTFIFGFVSVHGCRGPWNLTNLLTTVDIPTVSLLTVLATVLLVISRSLANISAPPFTIATDDREDYFLITTRFKRSATEEPALYILDCLFSSFVLGTLVSVVWRGVWVIFDLIIYPEDIVLSAWVSLAIGYGIATIAFSLQPCMRSICDQLEGAGRIAVADTFIFFSFIGTMSIWRGIWLLMDVYFLPENPLVSNVTSIVLSFILLMLLNCANSILARGVVIDAETASGRCVVFPIYYVRSFFAKQRSKKCRYLTDLLGEEYRGKNIIIVLEKNQPNSTVNVIRINASVLDDGEKSESSDTKDYTSVCFLEDDALIDDKRKCSDGYSFVQ